MPKKNLSAPFPYFGGKYKVAEEVWARFGDVDNYIEPFGGSLAVLLARPESHNWWHRKETAGDFSGHIVNFYRAVSDNPDKIAELALYPVTEADLTARHLYLARYENELSEKLSRDPKYYDAEAAAWWVWGISAWVGGDWMSGKGAWKIGEEGPGVYRKMPMVAGNHGGKGIHKPVKGIESAVDVSTDYLENLKVLFKALQNRLLRVRLICGDWKRIQGAAAKPAAGKITGVFLDPPYDPSVRRLDLYGSTDDGSRDIHKEARDYALSLTNDSSYRVAYCSYQDEEENKLFTEAGWIPYSWTASGGYGLQSDNQAKSNRELEIIWFSPNCLPIRH